MARRTRRHSSHKRAATRHRRRYGKSRKAGKTRRNMRGGVDLGLVGRSLALNEQKPLL